VAVIEPTEGSYDLEHVLTYLALHGELRDADRRVMRLNGRRVPESHRNTIANWVERPDITRAPLGRWDEILVGAGMMLHDFEVWEEDRYGDTSYTGPTLPDEAATL
jgi:hypothetical protein